MKANRKVATYEDAIKNLDFRAIDPEDLIGDALYAYAKKNGTSLANIEKAIGVRVRRLIPDDDSPQVMQEDKKRQDYRELLKKNYKFAVGK